VKNDGTTSHPDAPSFLVGARLGRGRDPRRADPGGSIASAIGLFLNRIHPDHNGEVGQRGHLSARRL